MHSQRPPDQDPELRRTLALDADAQCAYLGALVQPGDHAAPASTLAAPPPFQHVGLTVHRTPRGSLSCIPREFPDETILSADTAHLCILIDCWAFDDRRHAPRTPGPIAELEALIAEQGPQRGFLTIPYIAPRDWTIATVRAVIDILVQHVPKTADDTPTDQYHARVDAPNPCRNYATIVVSPYNDNPFSAKVRLQMVPAIQRWRAMVGNEQWCSARVADLDSYIRRANASTPSQPQTGGGESVEDNRHDDEDDDDLDAIERAARRTLHGDLGNTGTRERGRAAVDIVDAMLDYYRLQREQPKAAAMFQRMIAHELKNP